MQVTENHRRIQASNNTQWKKSTKWWLLVEVSEFQKRKIPFICKRNFGYFKWKKIFQIKVNLHCSRFKQNGQTCWNARLLSEKENNPYIMHRWSLFSNIFLIFYLCFTYGKSWWVETKRRSIKSLSYYLFIWGRVGFKTER